MDLCKVVLFLALLGISCGAESKSPCQGCKDLVDGILKGLDKTKNKNFGGGDTAWEEKKNLKYKTSETRLVEVLEGACAKDNFKCNEIASEREDDIETWYKTLQDSKPLHEYLCVQKAAVCCKEGKFGENCENDCPANSNGDICFGNGKCKGSGDKQGAGTCECDEGYSGDLCNECGPRHFQSFSNATYTMCSPCAVGCETCLSANDTDCLTCSAGFTVDKTPKPAPAPEAAKEEGSEEKKEGEEEKKEEEAKEEEGPKTVSCVDVNECVEQSDLCPVGEYCANTEGSYKCEPWTCSPLCKRCYGPTNRHCFECIPGAIMRAPFICQDIDECASGAICLGMYEQCINTIGHYRCQCARFFRRDPTTGQCQPDPAIYSRYLPNRPRRTPPVGEEEAKKEEEKASEEVKAAEGEEGEKKEEEKAEEKTEEKTEDENKSEL